MSDWQEVALTDIYDISSGLSKPKDSFGSGYPFLSFKEVFGNYFLPDELEQLVESSEKEREKGSIKRGDVFLTRTSETMHELGMSSVALKDYSEATFNGFTKRLRPKEDSQYEVHPEFMGYCLRSPSFRTGMLAFSTMSTRASLNNDMISRLVIQLPPIDVQKHIAKVLKALDNKIELNRKTNQTLEHIAQAIFKSWFVDFEPTRAKIAAKQAGQDPERAAMAAISGKSLEEIDQLSPEQQEQLKTTAALFPDALVVSELGEIPEGWSKKLISDFGKVVTGKTPPKKIENAYTNVGVPFITPTDIDDSVFVTSTARYLTDEGQLALKKTEIEPGSICVTCIGSQMGKTIVSPHKACTNQQINSIIISEQYLRNYLLLNLRNRREEIFLIGSSGSTMPIINKTTFEKLDVLLPSKELLEQFDLVIDPHLEKVLDGASENICLSEMRDLLLPKLLSGEELKLEAIGV